MSKPLILVTNDDGIVAPGIRASVEVARSFGEVVVVAPDSPQSAKGHAITIHNLLRLRQVQVFPDVSSWECSGTPVDCVKPAKHIALKDRKIDLCISGINHGSNASINILYSGTMSAAMEAALEGIRSVGFSLLDFSFEADFEAAKIWAAKIIQYALDGPFEGGQLLNVNIPKLPYADIKGLKICRQANARWVEEFIEGKDPTGFPYYWLTGKFVRLDFAEDTDIHALEQGYVSVVPSVYDLTDYPAIPYFKAMESL